MKILGTKSHKDGRTPGPMNSPSRRSALLFTFAGIVGAAAQPREVRAESGTPEANGTVSASQRNGTKPTADRRATSAADFPDLKAVGPQDQVLAIHQHASALEIVTADGHARMFQETDLRFKLDTSDKGPSPGRPVVLSGGMMGDRATVFFASPAEIGLVIKDQG